MIYKLAAKIKRNGGTAYLVGGFVRDSLIQKESKDKDILVTGISADLLERLLLRFSTEHNIKVDFVGKSFGVFKLGNDIDIALPRVEQSTGEGHKDFKVIAHQDIPLEKDLERRDFTINAIAKNLHTDEIVDPFNGVTDLKNGVLKAITSESFKDDPLRMLRGIQFCSRFGVIFNDATEQMLLKNKTLISTVSNERLGEEFKKFIHGEHYGLSGWAFKILYPEYSFNYLELYDCSELSLLFKLAILFQSNKGREEEIFVKFSLSQLGFRAGQFVDAIQCIQQINAMKKEPTKTQYALLLKTFGREISSLVKYCVTKETNKVEKMADYDNWIEENDIPITKKDLKINGDDLLKLGLIGKEIGDTLEEAHLACINSEVKNAKGELLAFVKS